MKLRMIMMVLVIAIMMAGCSGDKAGEKFVEGKHYVISSAHEESKNPQIVKFVSFACPACRGIEEALDGYKPADGVAYERFQVRFGNKSNDQLMRSYATLRVLNIHEQLKLPLFEAIQDQRIYLGDKHSMAIWVNKQMPEIKMDVVKKAYVHPKTADLINMYYAAEQRYNIKAIPTIWVNGNLKINLQNVEGDTPEEKNAFLAELLDHLTKVEPQLASLE